MNTAHLSVDDVFIPRSRAAELLNGNYNHALPIAAALFDEVDPNRNLVRLSDVIAFANSNGIILDLDTPFFAIGAPNAINSFPKHKGFSPVTELKVAI